MNWRDTTKSAVKAKARSARKNSRGASNNFRISRVGFSVLAHPFLVRAAAVRGMTLSGYIRRATLAFAAHDLGLNRIDLFEKDAAITPIDRIGSPSKDLSEELYGSWEVQSDDSRPERAGGPAAG